jgi:uncharacterized protein YjbI with pentapeptide repeats
MVRWFTRFVGSVALLAAMLAVPVLSTATQQASADTVVAGCTIVSNPTPTHFTNCPNWSTNGASLTGLDLSYANLAGSTYTFCSGSVIQHVTCTSSDLTGANLNHANLSGASFSSCLHIGPGPNLGCGASTLSGANFTGADLSNANLATTDLTNANLTGANLTGAGMGEVFSGVTPSATLTGANLTGTLLVPSNLSVTATSAAGATAAWATPSGIPGTTPGSCTPASGTTFPLYSTTVTCQVLDAANDVATGPFQVYVLPTTQYFSRVRIPSDGASLSATALLDAAAGDSPGVTKVQFELTGGTLNQAVVATGSLTLFGWLAQWDTTTVPNRTYTLQSVATDAANDVSVSTGISLTVNNGATIKGGQWLDAWASPGVTKLVYELTGGTLADSVIATATPTWVGWLAGWNSTSVPNGTYTLQSAASYVGGVTGTSPGVTITVSN